MRITALLIVAFATLAEAQTAPKPTPAAPPPKPPMRNVGTMSDLMVKILYPSSDALFYIETRTPKTDTEWTIVEGQALMLAESANLLMMPGRARDPKQWMDDSKLLLDVGAAALKAAKAKDVAGIAALSDQLYASCTTCHTHYRPGYGKKP
jgi:hypothetical protein